MPLHIYSIILVVYTVTSELTTASYHPLNVDCHPAQALANNINNILLYTRRNAKTFYLNLFSCFGDEYAFRGRNCVHIYIYISLILYTYIHTDRHIYTLPIYRLSRAGFTVHRFTPSSSMYNIDIYDRYCSAGLRM